MARDMAANHALVRQWQKIGTLNDRKPCLVNASREAMSLLYSDNSISTSLAKNSLSKHDKQSSGRKRFSQRETSPALWRARKMAWWDSGIYALDYDTIKMYDAKNGSGCVMMASNGEYTWPHVPGVPVKTLLFSLLLCTSLHFHTIFVCFLFPCFLILFF